MVRYFNHPSMKVGKMKCQAFDLQFVPEATHSDRIKLRNKIVKELANWVALTRTN